MIFLRRQAVYVAGVIAVVSGIIGILSWWLPWLATWLNRHGFVAWPLAAFFMVLFVWAALNWYQISQDLASIRLTRQELVEEDKRLFGIFKEVLPKEANVVYWLRNRAEARSFHESDIRPLSNFVADWRSSDRHYVNAELEHACKQFIEAASEFFSYQGYYSHWAPQSVQTGPDDPLFYVYDHDGTERPIQLGLGERADRVLEAHNELYMLGSRLGL
jgi:hypothetical protein